MVERGCRVPGLRAAYEAAHADWCGWAGAGGYSPRNTGWNDEQKAAHQDWYRRATDAIRAAERAIIEAGCTSDVQQEALF